jgi:hypothetical protein
MHLRGYQICNIGGEMNVRLSKLMRTVIVINVVITLMALAIHGYYIHRTFETNDHIIRVMQEKKVIKETAIRLLEKEGVDLYFPRSITEFSGVVISIVTLVVLYVYSQTNGFMAGFMAAFCAVFSTYIGGFLLFYVFLSGKSERIPNSNKSFTRDEWQIYIHEKCVLN